MSRGQRGGSLTVVNLSFPELAATITERQPDLVCELRISAFENRLYLAAFKEIYWENYSKYTATCFEKHVSEVAFQRQ
jgi:hypothetical protein